MIEVSENLEDYISLTPTFNDPKKKTTVRWKFV